MGRLEMARISYLDGWRGMAIAVVLAGHFIPALSWSAPFGVELFFVLSGRLMAQILVYDRPQVKDFFIRRASRIFPALYIYLACIFVLEATKSSLRLSGPALASSSGLATSATMTFNYWYVLHPVSSSLDHIWSLCVEEHSYIVLGLIIPLLAKKPARALLFSALCATAFAANGLIESYIAPTWLYQTLYWRSDVRAFSIFISFSVYVFFRERNLWKHLHPATSPCFLIISIIIAACSADQIRYTLGTFGLTLSVITLDFASQWWRGIFSSRVLTVLGRISYSLYLWQELGMKLSNHIHVFPRFIWAFLVIAPSVSSYFLVERPSRLWLNNHFSNSKLRLKNAFIE